MTDQITDWFSQHIVHGALQLGSRMSILAVSGGVDSMVMAELYLRSGCPVVLAHVNYQLRGEESNGDEEFVREWARERGLPFEMLRVDGRQEFKAQGEGIQEGARRIRYEWLEEIRKKHDAQWIATAHHLNDSVETALFHLIRGCGLRGLHGIPFKSGSMLRPLLGFTKEELLQWAASHGVFYRTDSSNETLAYTRNQIRHTVIPQIQHINPDFIRSAGQTISRIRGAELLIDWAAEWWRQKVVRNSPIPGIQGLPLDILPDDIALRREILYELLRPFGFNSTQIHDLTTSNARTGARAESFSHELQFDRRWLRWAEKSTRIGTFSCRIESLPSEIVLPSGGAILAAAQDDTTGAFSVTNSASYVCDLSAQALTFPLIVRGWRPGDAFCPSGMGGHSKTLKKYFADEKVPLLAKYRTWVVVNGNGDIIWLVGHRVDERYLAKSGEPSVRFQYVIPKEEGSKR